MKTILVPFRDDDTARAAVAAGSRVAQMFESYIEGLFIQTPPLVYASEGIAIGGYVTQLADEERRRAEDARERFKGLMEAASIRFEAAEAPPAGSLPCAGWRQVDGLSEQVVGEYGRIFDLVVVGRETKGSSPDWGVMSESALFDAGRLMLLAPPQMPSTTGDRVTIIWNGSTETARTISMSMPFLLKAKEVVVLSVEGAMVPGPTGEQVARSLAWHGINVSARTAQLAGRGTGQAVLEEAENTGADLFVKGAYAHSRLRQMIFGGPTRQILSNAEVPVLMAH